MDTGCAIKEWPGRRHLCAFGAESRAASAAILADPAVEAPEGNNIVLRFHVGHPRLHFGRYLGSSVPENKGNGKGQLPGHDVEVAVANSRQRDECLNQHWFLTSGHARQVIEGWRTDYSQARPHGSLAGVTRHEFLRLEERKLLAASNWFKGQNPKSFVRGYVVVWME